MGKNNKDVIILNKKVMLGVAPAIAIIAILFSRHQPGPLLLFLVGISVGIIIGVNLKAKQK